MKALYLPICFLFFLQNAVSQDAEIYTSRDYSGTPIYLSIGQTTAPFQSGSSGLSIKILNQNAAVKVELVNIVRACTRLNSYPQNFFYAEINQPFIEGTDQYNDKLVRVSCIEKKLPIPKIFIPIDRTNANPDIDSWRRPIEPSAGKRMLMIKKANFWENSEDVCGLDGPYEEINFNVCYDGVMNYTYEELVNNEELWHALRIDLNNIPGPAYDADMGINPFPGPDFPDPRNEWIDNWFGVYYSNCGMWDWDAHPAINQIAVIISGADPSDPEDVLGRALIDRTMDGCILIKCRMFGWVVVKNVDFPESGSGHEATVDVAGSYLYLNWDGNMIENQYGPGVDTGTMYHPFASIEQVEAKVPIGVMNGNYRNNYVGVLGDGIISAPNNLTAEINYVPATPTLCETYSYSFNWDDRQRILYYRTRQTGDWNDVNTWETSPLSNFSSGIKTPANAFPNSNNTLTVNVLNGHTVTVTEDVKSKKTTVNSGGRLFVNPNINFTIVP